VRQRVRPFVKPRVGLIVRSALSPRFGPGLAAVQPAAASRQPLAISPAHLTYRPAGLQYQDGIRTLTLTR